MPRNRWRSGGWWRSNYFNESYGGGNRWRKTQRGKPKKKKDAWRCAFDYLPDLDERYDLLEQTLPLINVRGFGETSQIDDSDNEVLIGSLRGNVVGVRYYKGTVNNHEMVSLVRQPDNQYDRNAVKVNNVMGEQVGHIKKELAAALAQVMDRRLARVEGVVPHGADNVFSMPVDLTLWGQADSKDTVVRTMKQYGYAIHEGLSYVPAGGNSKSYNEIGSTSFAAPGRRTFLTPVQVKSELDKLFEQIDEGDKCSEAEPCAAISTVMFTHQKQALSWMMRCENVERLPPFWQQKGIQYFNSLTMFSMKTKPSSIRGGILADDMGLGKTLEIIALILTNFEDGKPLACPVPNSIRPSKIAQMNRLKMYRQSFKSESGVTDAAQERRRQLMKSIPEKFTIKPILPPQSIVQNVGCKRLMIDGNAASCSQTPIQVPSKKLLVLDGNNNNDRKNADKEMGCVEVVNQNEGIGCTEEVVCCVENIGCGEVKTESTMAKSSDVVPGKKGRGRGANVKNPKKSKKGVDNTDDNVISTEKKNDPDFCVEMESSKLHVLAVISNASSRPKRTIRKPAMYRDDEDEEPGSPEKKPKLPAAVGDGRKRAQKKGPLTSVEMEPTVQKDSMKRVDNKPDSDVVTVNAVESQVVDSEASVVSEIGLAEECCTADDSTVVVQQPPVTTSIISTLPFTTATNTMSQQLSATNSTVLYRLITCPQTGRTILQPVIVPNISFSSGTGMPASSQYSAGLPPDITVQRPQLSADGGALQRQIIVLPSGTQLQQRATVPLNAISLPRPSASAGLPPGCTIIQKPLTFSPAIDQSIPNSGLPPCNLVIRNRMALPPNGNMSLPHTGLPPRAVIIRNPSSVLPASIRPAPFAAATPSGIILRTPMSASACAVQPLSAGVNIVSRPLAVSSLNPGLQSVPQSTLHADSFLLAKLNSTSSGDNSLPKPVAVTSVEGEMHAECSSSYQPTSSSSSRLEATDDNSSDDDDFPDVAELVIPPPSSVTEYGQSTGRTVGRGPRATLIVCPLSTLSSWLDQLEQHIDERVHLQVYTYYGHSRTHDAKFLSQHDIVLTTYQTLSSDNKGHSPLQKVHWLRLVLDEGHTIRNPNAQMTKAVLAINAERKWVVTGTPIQNSIKDLWPLIKLLNVDPFQDKQWWDRTIEKPVTRGDEAAVKRVQCLFGSLTLRRLKTQVRNGKPIVDLPKRDVFIEHIELSDEERRVYDAMQTDGKLLVSKYFKQGTLLNHYGEVLAIMMRLRQLCCHPLLVAKAADTIKEAIAEAEAEAMASGQTDSDEIRKKLIDKILMVLKSGSDEECAICLDELKTPVITQCAHLFCRPCIEQVINTEKPTAHCPMCRASVTVDSLVEVPPDYEEQQNDVTLEQSWYSSAKVDALMSSLLRLRAEDKTIKSVVVSQFTSYLTLLETPLRNHGFYFVRLDGTMSSKQRTAALEAFADADPSSPTIFLLSLKAGGVGINLTAACRIFLMDPAWNPATEDQCFDRCHRLGQTRDVVVTKFVVENSVEVRMLELQERKRKLAAGVLGGQKQTADQRRNTRIEEIRKLIDL